MGLTINYTLSINSATIEEVRAKIITLRNIALKFPLVEVGGLVELAGQDCIFKSGEKDDPHHYLKLKTLKFEGLTKEEYHDQNNYYGVNPKYLIVFDTLPGQGSESAIFGLATYQEIKERNDWSLSSFCKTQYASNPEYGGLENFIRCHKFIVEMLDEIQKLGISCKVDDEGEYWSGRNLDNLMSNLRQYNFFVAALAGTFKNQSNEQVNIVQAPVLDYPNFEYLEAEGQELLKEKLQKFNDLKQEQE